MKSPDGQLRPASWSGRWPAGKNPDAFPWIISRSRSQSCSVELWVELALIHPVQSMPGSSGGRIEPAHQKEIGGERENDARLGERGQRFAFLEVINDGQDPPAHLERGAAGGKPAVGGVRPEAGGT